MDVQIIQNGDFLSWNKPTGDICDKCASYMIEKVTKSETKVICSNKECKNEMVKESIENKKKGALY